MVSGNLPRVFSRHKPLLHPVLFLCLSYYVCNDDPEKGFVSLVLCRTMVPITISQRWWVHECSDPVFSLSHADGLFQNRFRELDLVDRVLEELWMEVHDVVQEKGIKTIPKKKKCKKAKSLSGKALLLSHFSRVRLCATP